MKSSEYQSRAEQVVLHTYNRFPVVLDHGKGVRLYDVDGNEYLDFGAGIAVCALGYGDPDYEEALKNQIGKLTAYVQSLLQCACHGSRGKAGEGQRPEQGIFHQQRHGSH